tara:strand:- start:406 stop:525 length:120 start_codon:yes stop_codon:yes gene_type:complete
MAKIFFQKTLCQDEKSIKFAPAETLSDVLTKVNAKVAQG